VLLQSLGLESLPLGKLEPCGSVLRDIYAVKPETVSGGVHPETGEPCVEAIREFIEKRKS